SAPIERLLTVTRSRWLAEPGALTRDRWPHAAAVAIQCFLNEFVWTVTEEEARAVDALETRVSTALEAGNGPDEAAISDLLLLACYRPLWRLGIGGRLAAIPRRDWPESLADLMRLGLHDPLRERALEDRIASGAPIGDGVSKAV
ncbi:MAG: hypothetical protein GWO02_16205, partial [Gammaproteobacteria bacterium]|nr:hypothetical protein [Gammaproteobacteria bacterium]